MATGIAGDQAQSNGLPVSEESRQEMMSGGSFRAQQWLSSRLGPKFSWATLKPDPRVDGESFFALKISFEKYFSFTCNRSDVQTDGQDGWIWHRRKCDSLHLRREGHDCQPATKPWTLR